LAGKTKDNLYKWLGVSTHAIDTSEANVTATRGFTAGKAGNAHRVAPRRAAETGLGPAACHRAV